MSYNIRTIIGFGVIIGNDSYDMNNLAEYTLVILGKMHEFTYSEFDDMVEFCYYNDLFDELQTGLIQLHHGWDNNYFLGFVFQHNTDNISFDNQMISIKDVKHMRKTLRYKLRPYFNDFKICVFDSSM
jgi:hypothetical protein